MSLLTIVQDAYAEAGITPPLAVAEGGDNTAFALANRALKDLRVWGSWQALQKRFSFNTVASQEAYDLPSDWPIDNTFWNASQIFKLQGPLNPDEWEKVKTFNVVPTPSFFFRIFSDQIHLFPTPDSILEITFGFVSLNAVLNKDGTTEQPKFINDDDTAILNEDLITQGLTWRILRKLGLEYQDMKAEAEADRNRVFERERADRPIIMGQLPDPFVVNIPDGSFGI